MAYDVHIHRRIPCCVLSRPRLAYLGNDVLSIQGSNIYSAEPGHVSAGSLGLRRAVATSFDKTPFNPSTRSPDRRSGVLMSSCKCPD